MDSFLDYLVKKSDINNNEFFNYRSSKSPKLQGASAPSYTKLTTPEASSYVVFDFETTGMKAGINTIIEIGAVKVTNKEISGVFNVLINPEQYIPHYISNITHITNSMVEDKRTIKEVLPDFISFCSDLPLVAHNARFDMSFLLSEANKLGFEVCNPVIDTLYLSRKYNKECEKHNLNYLTNFFNIDLKNAHRAYFDALATNEVYKIIQKKYYNTK